MSKSKLLRFVVGARLENASNEQEVSMSLVRIGLPVRMCSIHLFNYKRSIESLTGTKTAARRHGWVLYKRFG
jgi:hypothetical protein